jgi:3-deoxy-manno-octulosonate cytidylyltransferase (CMP-KDO synthetase)
MLDEVYIATCDNEIIQYAERIGAKAVGTMDTHERASDRTAEAMIKIEHEINKTVDIVVMIQGDEPMIVPEMIDMAVGPLINDTGVLVSNLMAPLHNRDEHADSNEVKVVVDKNSYALYFSREPIPSWKMGAKEVPMNKQICIIPFRREFLIKFNELSQTSLEKAESIDMLRVLEHGYDVKMVSTNYKTYSVDTIDDLHRVENLMENDSLIREYKMRI